jgi:hypothetical protein
MSHRLHGTDRRSRLHSRARIRSRRSKVVTAIVAAVLVSGGAVAASNWVVGLTGGSSGQAESGSPANLTIVAVASPSPSNLLFPGGDGDVLVTITNLNAFPVTITAVDLPTDTTYASGYTTSALTTAQAGCTAATPSDVIWNFSTATLGSGHTLTSPLVVAANGQSDDPLVVTLTNAAAMTAAAPAGRLSSGRGWSWPWPSSSQRRYCSLSRHRVARRPGLSACRRATMLCRRRKRCSPPRPGPPRVASSSCRRSP